MYKKGNKIIASIVIFIMMLAHVSTIGANVGIVLGADSKIKNQNSKTGHQNVEFNTYFQDGEYEVVKNVEEQNKVVAQITVKNAGYLKDARIDFIDSNFKISDEINSNKIVKIENNSIVLNQIDNGENVQLELPFTFETKNIISEQQLNKISSAIFTGTYIDEKGKESKIRKEINLNLKWTTNTQALVEAEITKYVPYNIKGQKGLIMQVDVKSSLKDNVLPIKQNRIEISVPEINNNIPEEVTVYNKTGKENFTSNYDKQNKKLTIIAENAISEKGEITFDNNNLNEFIITYKYSEEMLPQETVVAIEALANIQIYSYEERGITSNFLAEVALKEKIGNIVDFTIEGPENLSKGYIYANYNREEKIGTEYTEKVTSYISMHELIDRVKITLEPDKYIIENREYTSNTYYKNLKIEKEAWLKILGQEGIIKIITENNEVIINKNTEVATIELNASKVIIETSKPENDGELVFNFVKEISGDNIYTKVQMKNMQILKQQITGVATNEDIVIVEKSQNAQTVLVETQTEAELVIDNTNFSTVVPNEDVEFKVVLKTDSIYNKLYEDPIIIIELPAYIENINIKNIQLPFEDELKIRNVETLENNGKKQIKVTLTGIQTKYSIGAISKGANIVITADIIVNNLTPSKQETIKTTCINGEQQIELSNTINFIAPTGIVTVNKIENYALGASLMALTENEEDELEVQTVEQNAKAEIQVINNYNNKINNIRILGRTLMKDVSNIDSNESLENTFDAPITSTINTNGLENVSIYYSENGSATEDLANIENGWQTQVTDYSKVKSYLIVLNNYEMNIGDSIKFNYDVQVPANLGYSETVNSLYTVYFDNIKEEQTIKDRAKSNKVTLSTGTAPELQVELKANVEENSIVREGQYIKFTATVKNVGEVDATNVKLNITAPSEVNENVEYKMLHTEFKEEDFFYGYDDSEEPEKQIVIGNLNKGKETIVEFDMKIDKVKMQKEEVSEADMAMKARVMADDMQKEVNSNEYNLKLSEADLTLMVKADKTSDSLLIKDDELTYTAKIEQKNYHNSLKNVKVKIEIPKGLEIQSAKVNNLVTSDIEIISNVDINKETNIVEFTIEELYIGYEIDCNVVTKVKDAFGEIIPKVIVTAENKQYVGNIIKNKIGKLDFTITQTKLDKPYVKESEEIVFEYIVTNTSDVYCSDFTFENLVPEGMEIVSVEMINQGQSVKVNNYDQDKLVINKTFKGNETIKFKITMKANLLENGTTQKETENYASIYGQGFDKKDSNKIKVTIEYNKDAYRGEENPGGSTSNPEDIKNIISGTAWLDENSNGERNDNEQTISGIEVRLLNAKTNEIVKTTTTSSTGEYTFTQVEQGDYIIVILYNSAKYDLTEYRAHGVENSVNSDFINAKMEINGKEQTVAISNTIRIKNENERNIDIGLIESHKSDLRLDKYISEVTLTYGNTVKTYNYENVKLAKVEIPAKELAKATVIVTYKIVVTNEGAITNYVKKIVDYIPKDMKFNSELNRDWYQSTNGDLYNSSLANTKLESGQSKEVTLTLTRKMTNSNVGIVNNNAELYEVYNEEGIKDIDSTPANKVNGEDDISAADLVISVKTGDAIIYTTIISSIICIIIGISIYYIRKIVLRKM